MNLDLRSLAQQGARPYTITIDIDMTALDYRGAVTVDIEEIVTGHSASDWFYQYYDEDEVESYEDYKRYGWERALWIKAYFDNITYWLNAWDELIEYCESLCESLGVQIVASREEVHKPASVYNITWTSDSGLLGITKGEYFPEIDEDMFGEA